MFPRNENRNEGTFACSPRNETGTGVRSHVPPGTKIGTRVHSAKPPFYETAILSPSDYSVVKFFCDTTHVLFLLIA